MIDLYKFGTIGPVSDPSPFCVKLEAYLKLAQIPYETRSGMKYLRASPKGKLPYISDEGKIVADSSFIISYLKEKYPVIPGDDLDNQQRATAHAFIKMIDENLYWTLVHARWGQEDNWLILKDIFFGSLPFPLKLFIPDMVRKNVLKGLKSHGIGRHSDAEIVEIACRDLQALSDYLGDKPWFFGDRPGTLDATAYGILSEMILLKTFTAPVFDKARLYENLVDFTNRFHAEYFADS